MGLPARDTSERRNKNEPRKGISKVQDMDLIEVLWKQDVDLGFTLVEPTSTSCKKKVASTSDKESEDEIEKLKALEAINATNQKEDAEEVEVKQQQEDNPWAGRDYTVDLETESPTLLGLPAFAITKSAVYEGKKIEKNI
ncbi:hypothetical protein HZH68_006382 [Vespula germanica]|uniref:Uncharacterized protein n=1 Tax=Vespula germanica TaxID=30212 RepID=A0A834KBF1_VESGE|nr:hypothetical protein HZH68_006382 [Vespula germanica]